MQFYLRAFTSYSLNIIPISNTIRNIHLNTLLLELSTLHHTHYCLIYIRIQAVGRLLWPIPAALVPTIPVFYAEEYAHERGRIDFGLSLLANDVHAFCVAVLSKFTGRSFCAAERSDHGS